MDSGELNTDEKNALQALNGTIESLLEKTTESGYDVDSFNSRRSSRCSWMYYLKTKKSE